MMLAVEFSTWLLIVTAATFGIVGLAVATGKHFKAMGEREASDLDQTPPYGIGRSHVQLVDAPKPAPYDFAKEAQLRTANRARAIFGEDQVS